MQSDTDRWLEARNIRAGRQLDVLVAERFMEIEPFEENGVWFYSPLRRRRGARRIDQQPLPAFSIDFNDAWKVVERLRQQGWLVTTKDMPDGISYIAGNDPAVDQKLWVRAVCELYYVRRYRPDDGSLDRRFWHAPTSMGASVPEAICRAALSLVEMQERFGLNQ